MKLKNKGWACIALAVCLAVSSVMGPSFADVQTETGYVGESDLDASNELLPEFEPDEDEEVIMPSNEEDGSDDGENEAGEGSVPGESGIENEDSENSDDGEALLQLLSDMLEEDPLAGSTDPDDIALVLFGEGNIPEGMEVINDPDYPWAVEYPGWGDMTKTVSPINTERDSSSILTIRFTKATSLSFHGKPLRLQHIGRSHLPYRVISGGAFRTVAQLYIKLGRSERRDNTGRGSD